MKFILASKSPRRKEILEKFGYDFIIKDAVFNEISEHLSPVITILKNSEGKAKSVFDALNCEEKKKFAVIGADTVVFLDGKILGKPATPEQAEKDLKELSGKSHFVYTGYAVVYDGICVSGYDRTEVVFNDLPDSVIKEYVATGSPMDKAGSYGIQDGFDLVKRIDGSLYNVIGFPIEKLKPILDTLAAK